MTAIKSIAAGLALFMIISILLWLGGSFMEMSWQSINPADWSKDARVFAFILLLWCGVVGFFFVSSFRR